MSTRTVFALAILTIVSFAGVANGDQHSCKTAISAMIKSQLQYVVKCIKELGLKGKEITKKFDCVTKCVMVHSGAINEDGKIDTESAMAFVVKNIPDDYLDKALEHALECQPLMNNLDPKEEDCKSYEPLLKCLSGFIFTLCDT